MAAVAGLILAMVGLALVPAVRRGLLRVVSGDPVSVGCTVDAGASAMVLELRSVGAAAPVELSAVLVERRLAERLEPEPPRGLVEASPTARPPAGLSSRDWVAWTGSVPLAAGGTTRLEIRCTRPGSLPGAVDAKGGEGSSDGEARDDGDRDEGTMGEVDGGGGVRSGGERGDGIAGAPVAGRVAVVYRYRSVLGPMSSTAFVDVARCQGIPDDSG